MGDFGVSRVRTHVRGLNSQRSNTHRNRTCLISPSWSHRLPPTCFSTTPGCALLARCWQKAALGGACAGGGRLSLESVEEAMYLFMDVSTRRTMLSRAYKPMCDTPHTPFVEAAQWLLTLNTFASEQQIGSYDQGKLQQRYPKAANVGNGLRSSTRRGCSTWQP